MNELVITDPVKIMELSQALSKSNLIPASFKKPEDCFYALMLGAELGLSAMFSLTNIYVAKSGRPTMESSGKLAMVQNSGKLKDMQVLQETDAVCEIMMERKEPNIKKTVKYTLEQAKTAGLYPTKDNWKNYPARMLKARVIGWLCDDLFTDVCKGISTKEDIEDLDRDNYQSSPLKPEYEVSDKAGVPDKETANLLLDANALVKASALPDARKAYYELAIKEAFKLNDKEGLDKIIQKLAEPVIEPEPFKSCIESVEEIIPEPVKEPEPAKEEPASEEVVKMWNSIGVAFNRIVKYNETVTQQRSILKHLGVEKLQDCRDIAKLTTYSQHLLAEYNKQEKARKETDTKRDPEKAYQLFTEIQNLLSAYLDLSVSDAELTDAGEDVAKLTVICEKLKARVEKEHLQSSVPFGGQDERQD